MDKLINHTYNFGLLFSTFGLIGELRSRKEEVTKCLVTNGNIALSLFMIGTTVKIYRDFTKV